MEIALWDHLPTQLSWKEKIAYLGVTLKPEEGEPAFHVEHEFSEGMYVRKMHIPAQSVFLGREHLKGHEVVLAEGSAILITPQGKKRYDAWAYLLTPKGFHTVAYTLTDVIAHTRHPNPTNCTDVEALESAIFGSVADLRALGNRVKQRLLS